MADPAVKQQIVEALKLLAAASPEQLANAASALGVSGVHRTKLALTRVEDALLVLEAGVSDDLAGKVAAMRDIQRAYMELLEVMEYPIDQAGKTHDLNAITPAVLGIAWTASLYGFRRSADPLIKKRRINLPGLYDNACTWVDVNAPDDAARDLQPGDFSADRLRPPDVRGMAASRDGEEPAVIAEWHVTPAVTYTDEPRPKD